MNPSRRKFLAAAAVIPAAVAISPVAPLAAEAALSIPTEPYPWGWYFSTDGGEMYHEQCDTMEQAIKIAKEYGGGLVAECQRQDFWLEVDGAEILEMLYMHNEEAIGEGEFIEATSEQERELGRMVTEAIGQWVAKNKIDITAWTFGGVRNRTFVEPVPNSHDFSVSPEVGATVP